MNSQRVKKVKAFAREAMSAEHEPARSISEVRYRATLATLDDRWHEKIIDFAMRLVSGEHPDFAETPSEHPDFYEMGNIVLAYLAHRLSDVIESFAEHPLLAVADEAEETVLKRRAKARAARVVSQNQDLIKRHPLVFQQLDELIDLHQQMRSRIFGTLLGMSVEE